MRDTQIAAVIDALAQRPPRMQLIEGDAGTGKSALAASVAERLWGRRALVVTALAERATTPLGAFADVLQDLGAVEADITTVVSALGRAPEQHLLLVDDVPRLDEASSEVLRRVVRGFGLPIIATARRGEPLPEALRRLDADGLIRRHRLEGLNAAEVAQLLEARLRVPVIESDVHRLVWETDGNPLHVRVILESALEAGEVVHRGDVLEIARSASPTDLSIILASRLAALSTDARQLLAVIALAQPVPRSRVLRQQVRDTALADLLRRGMIVEEPGSRVGLRVAHPLLAEALDDADVTGASEEAVLLLRTSGDPSRRFSAAELEQRVGRQVAGEELVWAADYAAARGDHRAAAELAETAVRQPAPRSAAFAAHLAAATYRSLAHNLDESERIFVLAAELARDAGERAALASRLGEHLAFRRNDPMAAVAQGDAARAGLTAQEAVALDAELWRWRVLAERTSGTGTVEPQVRSAIAAVVAASMRGEPAAARAAGQPLTVPPSSLGELAATTAIALGLQRVVELRSAGSADETADQLEVARAQAGDEVGFFTVMLAAQLTQAGRLTEALRVAELAIEQLRRWDGGELLALALAVRATINAQRGASMEARLQLAELDDGTVSGAAVLQREEARAFLLAAEGDLPGAAEAILAVVADAIESGYRFLGGLTLANAIRFGEVQRTAGLAERLCAGMAERVEHCVALRDLALALRDGHPERVAPAARRLARAGLAPTAVDGLSLALALSGGDATRRRLHALATSLSAGIESPLFQRHEIPSLTARELEVARAAARRLRAREIGEQLGISARTVENQLYAVYRKLGIVSRDELREALADVGLLGD